MKGFLHLIEVAVAAILIMIVLGLFFTSQSVKLNWERPNLISMNSNILQALKASGSLDNIFSDTSAVLAEIDGNKPANVEYGLRISGVPKNIIKVGCPTDCSFVRSTLSKNVFVNDRWIGFTVTSITMSTADLSDFDVIMLVDYDAYATYENNITNYLDNGGNVIAIHNVSDSAGAAFLRIFGLSSSAGSGASPNFTSYDPADEKIPQYFLGHGFFVEATNDISGGKKQGYLDIWETRTSLNLTSSYVQIAGQTAYEGDSFSLTGPDSNSHSFRVKKIMFSLTPHSSVFIQPMNTSFAFDNNFNTNYNGNNIIGVGSSSASCTRNGSAIWINRFNKVGDAHDYRTLVKAAAATSSLNWFIKDIRSDVERAEATILLPMCCDMPETAQIDMISWYAY